MAKRKSTSKNTGGDKSTALAVVKNEDFALLRTEDPQAITAVLAENLGDDDLSFLDLDRVTIPSGGQKAWELPTLSGEADIVKEFDAVMVYHKKGRVFWREGFDETGGGTPPDCAADDGTTGVPMDLEDAKEEGYGGLCRKCPMSRFGSGGEENKPSRSQACKEIKLLFLIRADDLLPIVLSLPPTSLRPAKRYILRLASKALPYYGVLTRFSLEEDKNKAGIKYSKVRLSLVAKLTDTQRAFFKQVVGTLRPHLQVQPVGAEDYAPSGGNDE